MFADLLPQVVQDGVIFGREDIVALLGSVRMPNRPHPCHDLVIIFAHVFSHDHLLEESPGPALPSERPSWPCRHPEVCDSSTPR